MNKEIKKAAALLTDKENKKAQLLAKLETDYKAEGAKLAKLQERLNAAADAEEYKNLLSDIRDSEAVLQFCKKKIAETSAQGLTDAEYHAIANEAKAAFDAIKKTQGAEINAQIEKLNELLTAFDADTAEINALLLKAAQLKGCSPVIYNAQTIAANTPDNRHYIEAFYRVKSARQMLKNQGIKV